MAFDASCEEIRLRALGARIGAGAEVSTAVMIPQLTDVRVGAFLADDTMIGGYELGGGWMKAPRVKVGKRSFVGNSEMAQIAVLILCVHIHHRCL